MPNFGSDTKHCLPGGTDVDKLPLLINACSLNVVGDRVCSDRGVSGRRDSNGDDDGNAVGVTTDEPRQLHPNRKLTSYNPIIEQGRNS